jgi:hypothetical protein
LLQRSRTQKVATIAEEESADPLPFREPCEVQSKHDTHLAFWREATCRLRCNRDDQQSVVVILKTVCTTAADTDNAGNELVSFYIILNGENNRRVVLHGACQMMCSP